MSTIIRPAGIEVYPAEELREGMTAMTPYGDWIRTTTVTFEENDVVQTRDAETGEWGHWSRTHPVLTSDHSPQEMCNNGTIGLWMDGYNNALLWRYDSNGVTELARTRWVHWGRWDVIGRYQDDLANLDWSLAPDWAHEANRLSGITMKSLRNACCKMYAIQSLYCQATGLQRDYYSSIRKPAPLRKAGIPRWA